MIFSDILATTYWWLTLFILGLGFLPLTFLVFKNFFDKGYIFSKILALTITSYVIFTLSLFHIVPFSTIGSSSIFVIITIVLFFVLRRKQDFKTMLRESW